MINKGYDNVPSEGFFLKEGKEERAEKERRSMLFDLTIAAYVKVGQRSNRRSYP